MRDNKIKICVVLLSVFGFTGLQAQTVKDIDGNVYKTVTIGKQVWMAKNLKTTKYNDGTPIPNIKVDSTWAALTTGAYSDYNNTPSNSTTYGRLYNWYAVSDARKLCPTGWHVPSDAEWTTLTTYLGGESIAGGKLKEIGITHWTTSNTGASNETGYTALPSGYRSDDGTYGNVGIGGNWWSSTENAKASAYNRDMSKHDSFVYRKNYYKENGFSVRCLRD